MAEQATEQSRQMPQHGEVCWNELMTNDSEAAQKFYGELFGWQFKTGSNEMMTYTEINVPGKKQFGGLLQMGKEFGETQPYWIPYFAVDDVEAAAAKATELGGNICMPPSDIPNVGRICVVSDPAGARFYLITLKSA